MPTSLEANWNAVRRRIADAAVPHGKPVALLAVTKGVPPELALELRRLGQSDLGENRADELERKVEHFRDQGLAARWHFVGHVQRNKARRIVRDADVIHSVDSIELVETLARIAGEEGRRPEIYLEVKLAPETTKTGLAPAALAAVVRRAGELPALDLVGLMTIAPLVAPGAEGSEDDRARAARESFAALARLARELEADPEARAAFRGGRVRTSMGMSDDFELAIAAGSDLVRIGGALFDGVAAATGGRER